MPGTADDPVGRWFVERGVPHLIEDDRASTDIWSRAWPILLIAYAAGGMFALDVNHWSLARNLLATVVIVAVLASMVVITNAVARRPLLSRPRSIGAPELAAFVVGPALPSMFFGQWDDALYAVLEGLAVLLVIYVVTSYGLIPLGVWAARRAGAELGALGRIVARGLPLLLLFTMFLFITPTCGRWPAR
jgi:ABC-type phosphate/phosphonate transport system permease subunit